MCVCVYQGALSQHLPLAQGNPRIMGVYRDVSHLDLEVNCVVSRSVSRCAFDQGLMRFTLTDKQFGTLMLLPVTSGLYEQ